VLGRFHVHGGYRQQLELRVVTSGRLAGIPICRGLKRAECAYRKAA
jgi:hypothetical protein